MSRDWEEQFRQWAKPPGKTEQERCDNAASAIRNGIKASDKLRSRGITVFVQGSYRNSTNVRRDSDVDVGILCRDTLINDFPSGMNRDDFDLTPATYQYEQYKEEIEAALVNHFGRSAVERGDKAFDVHETSYHVEADVAAFFEHRRYAKDGRYWEGVALRTDRDKTRIINWPEQHYQNGCAKNNSTGTRYKSIVRVLKALSNEMADQRVPGGEIPGFLVECLVWNVPDDRFQHDTYTADVRSVLVFLYENTKTDEACGEWVEVSGLKWLFRPTQKWTRLQANAFTYAAWNYVGLGGES
ncbi:MAG TPA: nucleotidyltransferase [Phycisphaerae bacterium]|nr:nucleotidyltransferase [Phycisphaerae bacterium]